MPALRARLECSTPGVAPGGSATCQLLVFNASDRVDEVTVTPAGPLAACMTVTPSSLALLPDGQGSFSVVVDLPVDAPVEAGPQPVRVEVQSGLRGTDPFPEERTVTVERRTELSLTLHEVDLGDGCRGVEARLSNRSNHPTRLHLTIRSAVEVTVEPPVLDLPAFGGGAASLLPHLDAAPTAPLEIVVRAQGDGVDLVEQVVLAPPFGIRTTEEPVVATPDPPPGGARRRWPVIALALVVVALVGLAAWLLPERTPDFDVTAFPELRLRVDRQEPDPWERTAQLMLERRGFAVGGDGADGRFGPRTRDAVRQFQRASSLEVTGRIGPEEWIDMLEHYWRREDPAALEGWQPEAAQAVTEEW